MHVYNGVVVYKVFHYTTEMLYMYVSTSALFLALALARKCVVLSVSLFDSAIQQALEHVARLCEYAIAIQSLRDVT